MTWSERLTGAMLDRLTHGVHILEANGESHHLKDSKKRLRRASGRESPAPQPPLGQSALDRPEPKVNTLIRTVSLKLLDDIFPDSKVYHFASSQKNNPPTHLG